MLSGKQCGSRTGVRLTSVVSLGIVCALNIPLLQGQAVEENLRQLSDQVAELTAVIGELRSEIVSSRAEIRDLRLELRAAIKPGSTAAGGRLTAVGTAVAQEENGLFQQQTASSTDDATGPVEERVTLLEENQQLLNSRLEEQYQTKVESASRYRTRLSGLIMLNGFVNHGSVDSVDLPNLALAEGQAGGRSRPAFSALQSQLGFETYGPTLAGARASAGLQFDFSGSSQDTSYSSSYGGVRLRTAVARLDWTDTSVVVGQDLPFVSPLSPTSMAALALPAFSNSGNLWAWIPQARVDHRFHSSEHSTLVLQGGILGPIRRGVPQPGYATRLAWAYGETGRPLTLGVGAYYSREERGFDRTRDGWAGTLDWMVPLGDRLDLSGEFYRGRGLGSLGAAQGRSVVFDGPASDPLSSMVGLNVTGGWSQLTFRPSATTELNLAHGEDQAHGRDLGTAGGYVGFAVSRNRSDMLNFIYRPRTDLVFSLEYRHLETWPVGSQSESAGHVNLGVGVLF